MPRVDLVFENIVIEPARTNVVVTFARTRMKEGQYAEQEAKLP